MANRWGISKEVEGFVKERDLNCVYCGITFSNSGNSYKARPTWEHVINDIKLNGIDNIALCCGSCNASKGSKLLGDWLKSKYCLSKGISELSVANIIKKQLQ